MVLVDLLEGGRDVPDDCVCGLLVHVLMREDKLDVQEARPILVEVLQNEAVNLAQEEILQSLALPFDVQEEQLQILQ